MPGGRGWARAFHQTSNEDMLVVRTDKLVLFRLAVLLVAHVVNVPERELLAFLLRMILGLRRPLRGRGRVNGVGEMQADRSAAPQVRRGEEDEQEGPLVEVLEKTRALSGHLEPAPKASAQTEPLTTARPPRTRGGARKKPPAGVKVAIVELARKRLAQGRSRRSVAREMGVPESTLRGWLTK